MHTLIVFVAKYLFLVPILALIWLVVVLPKKQRMALLIITAGGGVVCLVFAKLGTHFIIDPRPFIKDGVMPLFKSSTDNGFPSDHALLCFFLSFVIMRFREKVGLILMLLSAVIGWARVYSGVHHFYDVIGSFVIAAIAYGCGIGLQTLVERHNQTKA